MVIAMADFMDLNLSPVRLLAGRRNGEAAFIRIYQRVMDRPKGDDTVFLDFSGVEVLTATFFNAVVAALRDLSLDLNRRFFLVLANLVPPVDEEVRLILDLQGRAMLMCFHEDGRAHTSSVVGTLPPMQSAAFLAVLEGCTSAGAVKDRYADEYQVGVTGWNNHLAALARMSIIGATKKGRSVEYRPLVAWSV